HAVPADGTSRPAAQSDGRLGGRAGAHRGRGRLGSGDGTDGRGDGRRDRPQGGDPMRTSTAERLDWPAAATAITAVTDGLPVLELARGGQRLVDRAPAPFSIAEVFGSVRSMILPIAEEKRLEVRLVHPVPERRTGHERALSRVLLNLATNAVKFTDSGFVEIAAVPVGAQRLEFSVRDTGNGIDAGRLRPLYQPVRRPPAAQREHFSGSGLGLTICRKLVRAMG